MITVDYLLIAEDVKVDDQGKTSIINIVGRLNAPKAPVGLKNAKITAGIRAVSKPVVDETINMKLVLRNGEHTSVLHEVAQKITIEVGYSFAPIFAFDVLVFPEFDNYQIELYIDNERRAIAPIMVKDSAELMEP